MADATAQFLNWICEQFRAEGKSRVIVIWDEPSWHTGKTVSDWLKEHAYCLRRVGEGPATRNPPGSCILVGRSCGELHLRLRYNVAPAQQVLTIALQEGKRHGQLRRRGFVPQPTVAIFCRDVAGRSGPYFFGPILYTDVDLPRRRSTYF